MSLLLLDLQPSILTRLPSDVSKAVLSNSHTAAHLAVSHGLDIHFVRSALTTSEASHLPPSPAYEKLRSNPELAAGMHPDAPGTAIDTSLAPLLEKGRLWRKTRFGAFMTGPSTSKTATSEPNLQSLLERSGTVFIAGVLTSGAVLSAVRQLADLDVKIYVLRDCCGDVDESLHHLLMDKVIPIQASVVTCQELDELVRDLKET